MNTPSEIRHVAIDTIPHDRQRYDTVGDYWFGNDKGHYPKLLTLKVSDMGDWRYGIACAIHELIEAALLVQKKIDEAQVSEFDQDYENARQEIQKTTSNVDPCRTGPYEAQYRRKWACPCEITATSEPGEDVHAPYHGEHMVADNIERIVLRELGANWRQYEEKVGSMVWHGGHDPFGENGEASEDADDKG